MTGKELTMQRGVTLASIVRAVNALNLIDGFNKKIAYTYEFSSAQVSQVLTFLKENPVPA